MSLFIGNLARGVNERDLEDEFVNIGECTFRFKGNYAFVDYKDEKHADQAIKELNDKDYSGARISVQFSKKSEKYDASKDRRPGGERSDRGGDRGGDRFSRDSRPPRRDGDSSGPKVCYNCQKPGHFARECRERRRSRSRSNDRRGGRGGSSSRGGFRGRDFGDRGDRRGGRDFDRDRRPRYSRSRSGSNHRRDDRKRSDSGDRK